MGLHDKISNKADELTGKAKEAAGEVTGDEQLKAEGKADQAGAVVKDAIAEVKDTAGKLVDKAKGLLGRD
ncbi:CsbD family protein [Kutzneria sp. NPDC052558]|uniref:CsbD family protein n=1 Tax=Kutzneria sp. NPDC052558 TaxID=3364121 RepID=UPI0037C83EF7